MILSYNSAAVKNMENAKSWHLYPRVGTTSLTNTVRKATAISRFYKFVLSVSLIGDAQEVAYIKDSFFFEIPINRNNLL